MAALARLSLNTRQLLEYVDGIPRLDWEEKQRAWREDGIIVDFKYLGSEDEERGEEEVQKRELGDCKPGSWGC
jgi:hypothetical protein